MPGERIHLNEFSFLPGSVLHARLVMALQDAKGEPVELVDQSGVFAYLYPPTPAPPAFAVNDRVRCINPGSWTHCKRGTIIALNVFRSGDSGHLVSMPEEGAIVVVDPSHLEKL
jgi:hypothetical protein